MPLYRAPALGPALARWATVVLAIASDAFREFRELAQSKTPFVSTTLLRERTLAGKASTLEEKTDLLLAAVHATNSAAAVTELMYAAGGTTAIYEANSIQRHFRDIEVLKQHGFLSENRYETAGQVYLAQVTVSLAGKSTRGGRPAATETLSISR